MSADKLNYPYAKRIQTTVFPIEKNFLKNYQKRHVEVQSELKSAQISQAAAKAHRWLLCHLTQYFIQGLNTPPPVWWLSGFETPDWNQTDWLKFKDTLKPMLTAWESYSWTLDERKDNALTPAILGHIFEQFLPNNTKKKQGVYYTPAQVVDAICQQLGKLKLKPGHPQKTLSICDPACGSGAFLVGVLDASYLHWSYPVHCYGVDLDPLAVHICRLRLWFRRHHWQQAHLTDTLRCGDALEGTQTQLNIQKWFPKVFQTGGFDLMLGNPPYVGEKGHKELFRKLKSGPLGDYYQGRSDLFYFFFYLAFHTVRPGGWIAYLTTNYYPSATGAQRLRQEIKAQTQVRKLFDFQSLQLFDTASGQHNLLTYLQKKPTEAYPAQLSICQKQGRATGDELRAILSEQSPLVSQRKVPQHQLFQGPENILQITQQEDERIQQLLQHLDTLPLRLTDCCQIRQGIVSGADRVTLRHQRQWPELSLNQGIFVLNAEEYQTLAPSSLLKPWFKNSDIGPWQVNTQNHQHLIYSHRQLSDLPPPFINHLRPYRQLLSQRREVQQGRIQWWQLQWPRSAEIFDSEKIVAPQRHRTNRFAWSSQPWYASADVYYIYAPIAHLQLKYLLAWLNSPLVYLWLWHRGKRKGQMLELYHQPLSHIPILIPPPHVQSMVVKQVESLLIQGASCQNSQAIFKLIFQALNLPIKLQKFLQEFSAKD